MIIDCRFERQRYYFIIHKLFMRMQWIILFVQHFTVLFQRTVPIKLHKKNGVLYKLLLFVWLYLFNVRLHYIE